MAGSPTILDLITRVQIEPLKAGMAEASRAVSNSTTSMGGSFGILAGAVQASTSQMTTTLQSIPSTVAEVAASTATSTTELNASMGALVGSIDKLVLELNRIPASAFRAKASLDELNLSELKTRFADLGREAEITATGVGSLYGGFASLLGLGALGAFLGSIIDGFDKLAINIHKFSLETGISTQRAQEFEGAMAVLHIAPDQAEQSMIRLTRSLALAAEGSKVQSELFRRLGVDVEAFKTGQIDVIQVLEQMQSKTAGTISTQERLGIAMQLMGRNAKETAIVLGLTAEQTEALMGRIRAAGTITDQSIDSFALLSQQMTLLWQTMKGQLANAFAEILPLIKGVVLALDFAAFGAKSLYEIFRGLVGTIVTGLEQLGGAVLILAGQYELGMKVMSDANDSFKENWKQVLAEIKNSREGVRQTAETLFGDATKNFLTSLSNIKGGDTDILGGIAGGVKTRIEEWKAQLVNMRADADAFRGLELADEKKFWEQKLAIIDRGKNAQRAKLHEEIDTQTEKVMMSATIAERNEAEQKLAALNAKLVAGDKGATKERTEVQRELNAVLHKMAVEHYQEQIALDEEFVRASAEGSADRLSAVEKERDDVVAAYGSTSKQAIDANRKVFEEQMRGDKQTVEDVKRSIAEQSEAYKEGSQERINIVQAGIAKLKVMQDELAAGKRVSGAPESAAPIAPKAVDDGALRVAMRKTESGEIERVVQELVGRLSGEYKAETASANAEALKREEARLRESKATEDLAIQGAKSSADEQIRNAERAAQYDLISFSQKIAIIRGIIAAEHDQETAAIQVALSEAQIELAAAKTAQEREAAERRIAVLKEQQLRVDQQIAQREQQISDQVTQHQMQNAQRAAGVISNAFTSAFDKMLTSHTTFLNVMKSFWDQMVMGFARMGLQIVADWIRHMATHLMITILHQTATTAAVHAGQLAQTSSVVAGQTAQTAAENHGFIIRAAIWLKQMVMKLFHNATETTAQTTAQAAQTAAVIAGQASQTAAVTAGVAARAAIETAGNAAAIAATVVKNVALVMSEAGIAGAAGFASTMVALPFPENIAVAPGTMAAAIAGTLSNIPLASAREGFDVPSMTGGVGMATILHSREMVLPENLADNVRNMTSLSALHAGVSSRGNPGGAPTSTINSPIEFNGGGRGAVTEHHHYNVEVNNHPGAKPTTEDEMVAMIKNAQRRGRLATI